jgi:hypothetical protein
MTQTYLLTPNHTTLTYPLPELRSDLLSSFIFVAFFAHFFIVVVYCTVPFILIKSVFLTASHNGDDDR